MWHKMYHLIDEINKPGRLILDLSSKPFLLSVPFTSSKEAYCNANNHTEEDQLRQQA